MTKTPVGIEIGRYLPNEPVNPYFNLTYSVDLEKSQQCQLRRWEAKQMIKLYSKINCGLRLEVFGVLGRYRESSGLIPSGQAPGVVLSV